MNSSLIRTHIGNQYLVWKNDWTYGRVIEVKVLAKAYNQVKAEVMSEGYFRIGAVVWLPTDFELEEHWNIWGESTKTQ